MAFLTGFGSPCEDCPPGYVDSGDGRCQKTSYTTPTCFPTIYTVNKGDGLCVGPDPNFPGFLFGGAGGVFYDNITLLPWPIIASGGSPQTPTVLLDATSVPVPVITTIQNDVWGSTITFDQAKCSSYRLNKVGVWVPPPRPLNQWIGFVYCVEITQTKTYCLGVASDDAYRVYINGNLIIDHSGAGYGFSSWKIIPITLTAGPNVIDVRNLDTGVFATLGFEIYDATITQLQAVTTATGANGVPNPGNPTDLCQYIVFTTEDLINQTWQIGTSSGCACPEGYSLFTCDDQNRCIQTLYTEKEPCDNIKLTPCCGSRSPVIVAGGLIPIINVGNIVCIQDIDPIVGCWIVSITEEAVTYTGTYTPGLYNTTCEGCAVLNCKTCPDTYFTLDDCCTNEILLFDNGTGTPLPLFLHYTGSAIDGITPESIGTSIITEFCNEAVGCTQGCFELVEVDPPQESPSILVLDWEYVMQGVTTVDTCEECQDCRICYVLENCLDETDILVTGTDLSAYINQVLTIEGCKDKSYIVTLAENCDDCSQAITIITASAQCPVIPEPEPPAIVLNTRFVKPGYTTPSCSPEYTERVNCNYGDQLYARMLSQRYGLTVCCDDTLDHWEIKKTMLDFEAINDNNLTDCNNA